MTEERNHTLSLQMMNLSNNETISPVFVHDQYKLQTHRQSTDCVLLFCICFDHRILQHNFQCFLILILIYQDSECTWGWLWWHSQRSREIHQQPSRSVSAREKAKSSLGRYTGAYRRKTCKRFEEKHTTQKLGFLRTVGCVINDCTTLTCHAKTSCAVVKGLHQFLTVDRLWWNHLEEKKL